MSARALGVLCACVLGTTALAAPATMITILHTNDIHGHITPWRGWEGELAGKTIGGMDHLATAIKQVRAEQPNVLLLDAGDAIGDTMIADLTKGAAVIELMNALGYDAMTIGNHEPDFTAERLRELMQEARFPVLAANIREKKSGRLFTKPYLIKEIAGVKVGILGLAYPNTSLTTAEKNVADLDFRDIPEVARELVPQMRRDGAEIVIALTHYGLGADLKLAKIVPGIDLIVGGQSHNRVTEAHRVGETLVVQAGAHCSDLGRVDLTIANGRITTAESKLILLDHGRIASDPEIAKRIAKISAPFEKQLNEPIAEATAPIVRAQTIAGREPRKRDQESPADSLFADIIREQTGSDLALLPGVGYGIAIPAGRFTAADLRNLIPHHGKIVTMKLTGAEVRQILEQAIENAYTDDPEKKVGGMVQVSGIRFRYDRAAPFGKRLTLVEAGDAPLQDDKSYLVATNSMLAGGGHRYDTFLHGRDREEKMEQYQMIRNWIKARREITAPPPGRIEP